jgi:hypothetical protein
MNRRFPVAFAYPYLKETVNELCYIAESLEVLELQPASITGDSLATNQNCFASTQILC